MQFVDVIPVANDRRVAVTTIVDFLGDFTHDEEAALATAAHAAALASVPAVTLPPSPPPKPTVTDRVRDAIGRSRK